MPSLQALTGLGSEVTISGETYALGPLNRSDWAEIERRIISLRPDPIQAARELARGAPVEVAKEILTQAYRDMQKAVTVTAGEMDDWGKTLDGMVFQFWLQVRKTRPEVTEDQAGELLETAGKEYIDDLADKMQERFPDADREELLTLAMDHEEDWLRSIIAANLGLPEGNPEAPGTPGTQTNPSTGIDGTPS